MTHQQNDSLCSVEVTQSRKFAYSCVVDRDPDFFFQALYFISSLIKLARVPPADIFIHIVTGTDPFCAEAFAALGLHVVWIERFSEHSPHCNKINQLKTKAFDDYDAIVLCDCDLAFCENIEADVSGIKLGAKVVDFANPPLHVLRRILALSNIDAAPETVLTTFIQDPTGISRFASEEPPTSQGLTLKNNCNGGMYVVDCSIRAALLTEWESRANWLLERLDLLERYHIHVDQVSFAIATWALRIPVSSLPATLNFPIHIRLAAAQALPSPPKVIHFHRQFDAKGNLIHTGVEMIDRTITAVNTAHTELIATLTTAADTTCNLVILKHSRWLKWQEMISKRPLALPNHMETETPLIAIETIGQCQYECGYCPVSTHPKRKGRLDLEIIYSLLDELSEQDGKFQLRFHFYNEPTLDTRLPDIIRYARSRLPKTYMRLVTNGDLLDQELIDTYFSVGINQIAVSCHQQEVFERLSLLLRNLEPRPDIELRHSFRQTTWSNRLSSVDLSKNNFSSALPSGVRPWGCSFLTSQIDYQGNVHSCCEDFKGALIEGNIAKDSFKSIRNRAAARTKETYCGFFSGPCRSCAGLNDAKHVIDALVRERLRSARHSLPKFPLAEISPNSEPV
jgi:hypothetical protein